MARDVYTLWTCDRPDCDEYEEVDGTAGLPPEGWVSIDLKMYRAKDDERGLIERRGGTVCPKHRRSLAGYLLAQPEPEQREIGTLNPMSWTINFTNGTTTTEEAKP